MGNVKRKKRYGQVCVWAGTTLDGSSAEELEAWFDQQGFKVQFLEELETSPDMKDGSPVQGTGGRSDLFFAVHEDSIRSFAVARFQLGHIRWIEDVLSEGNNYQGIYPERVFDYCSW